MPPIRVRNPRTGVDDYEFTPPSERRLTAIASRLREGQREWAATALDERIAVLESWRAELGRRRPALQKALSADTGRWLLAGLEVDVTAGALASWCAAAPGILVDEGGDSSLVPGVRYESQRVPLGLLGVISPWNFPLVLSLIDAVPAVLAGCAVLIKPSEVTPRFIEPLRETIAAVPPLAAVLEVCAGAGETGAALIDQVDAVCFTGSVRTGRAVAAAAARNFIPAFLEMGGKDAAIVLASADVERAATALLRGSVTATGQVCYSIERIYVEGSIHDELVSRLVAKAGELEINFPDIHQGHLGPLIFGSQADILREHLDDALARGAEIRCGGTVEEHGGGLWMRPTVVTGVDHSMKLMREETFGPILPVMAVDNADEAVRLANDTRYGLSGAVFAGDDDEAVAVARRVNAGAMSVNDAALTGTILQDAEKNSFACSGLGGSRTGPASLTRFFRKKAIIVNSGPTQPLASLDEASEPVG